jgi:hypothetical protein
MLALGAGRLREGGQLMAKEMDSCVQAATGPIVEESIPEGVPARRESVKMVMARVGKEAPDFEASAYIAGEGFQASGCWSASIPVTLPLFDRQSCRQLPSSIRI